MGNLLTIIRIILAFSLLLIKPYNTIFFAIYTICGVTDILDGYIARKTRKASEFGARLDSLADIIFLIVMAIILYPVIIQKISYNEKTLIKTIDSPLRG